MAKMTEDQLKAITDAEMRSSVGYWGGKLAEQRRKAEYYYLALPKGDLTPPEVDGRSSVVVPYVRNVIESMLPQLMVKFTGGDSVVEFEASKPGDEPKAKNCTDYLNYLFWKKNSGHSVAYTWMKDALLQKRGIVKVWWDTRVDETKEEYRGLTAIELSEIMEDEEIEVSDHKAYPDEEDAKARQQAIEHATQQGANPQAIAQLQGQPPALLFDITAKRSKKGGKICIENVPPEEFLISRRAKTIADSPFVGHRFLRTKSDLKSMGYKNVDQLGSDDNAEALNAERVERNSWDDELAYTSDNTEGGDDSQTQVWVTDCYLKVDWDGDGIAEIRKVTRAGNQILENEQTDIIPFVSICPIPLPHKFFGLSVADLAMGTQFMETSILRSVHDNQNLQTNGRYYAVENQVNLDDLLTNRPGGVVRVKTKDAVGRLDQGMGDLAGAMSLLEYMSEFGEAATGWTRYSQGNDAKAIQGTATGANIITNKDDMRLDLIARNFAEGWVELFKQMLKLVCQHQDKKAEVQISGQWVDIDPREWRNQFDVNINVGLGVGNKDQQVMHLMAVIGQQEKVHAIGVASPQNIFNASEALAKLTGQKNGDKYFTDPTKQPPPPPKPDPEVIKGQVTMQVEGAKLQAQTQLEREKMQMKAQADIIAQKAQAEQMDRQQQMQSMLDQQKAEREAQLALMNLQQERELEQLKIQAENFRAEKEEATKIVVAQIQAEAQVNTPQAPVINNPPGPTIVGGLAAAEQKANETSAGDMGEIKKMVTEMHQQASAPKEIVRDDDGNPVAIKHGDKTRAIKRDDEGRVSGVE